MSLMAKAQMAYPIDYNPNEIKLGTITLEIVNLQENPLKERNKYWTDYFSLNKNIPQILMYQNIPPQEKSIKDKTETQNHSLFHYWSFWITYSSH